MSEYTDHLPAAMRWLRLNCSRPVRRWPSYLGPEHFGNTWGTLSVTAKGDVVLSMREDLLPAKDKAWLQRQGFESAVIAAGVVIYRHTPEKKIPAWLAAMQTGIQKAANVNWEGSSRHGGHWE